MSLRYGEYLPKHGGTRVETMNAGHTVRLVSQPCSCVVMNQFKRQRHLQNYKEYNQKI
jgi:hypothetical protein